MARGATARRNRQVKRAAAARVKGAGVLPDEAAGFTPEDEIAQLAERAAAGSFTVVGSTGLPLTGRDVAWDVQAAKSSLSPEQYPKAAFWRDPEGDPKTLAAYKIWFARDSSGLEAVWRGVTAVAGVLQGARGGVSIPDADVPAVKAKVEKYYAAARKKYGDDTIQVPWNTAAADAEKAMADAGWVRGDGEMDDVFIAAFALANAECGFGTDDAFAERHDYWREEFTHSTRCACGHPLAEHAGIGACGHVDGRGSCSCGEFNEAAVEVVASAGTLHWEPGEFPGSGRLVLSFADGERTVVGDVTPTRRARAALALTAAGETLAPLANIQSTYEHTLGTEAGRVFAQEALGLPHARHASWPYDGQVGNHGDVLHRSNDEAVFRLQDGTVAHATCAGGWLGVAAAARSLDAAEAAIDVFAREYPPTYSADDDNAGKVPITFWTYGPFGPTSRLRMIDAAPWDAIAGNYTATVRDEVERLMRGFDPAAGGQLILWRGDPGTGKTWALRALASEWRDWAEFHYITDPDAFFVTNPDYMVSVLLADTYDAVVPDTADVVAEQARDGKWRVLILEDTGELLAASAKDEYGQGLSRLLNVVDGMVGQGLRILALVTTNDELGDLHPAATRAGRCASRVEFGPLTPDEAGAWLAERGATDSIVGSEGATLADLYAQLPDAADAFQAEPMPGDECSCGHEAELHAGDAMDGACEAPGCDCQAFEAADEPSPVEASAVEPPQSELAAYGGPPLGQHTFQVSSFNAAFDAPAAVAMPPTEADPDAGMRWTATLCPEGTPTDDGRAFAPDALTWRDLPLSIGRMLDTPHADVVTEAPVCARMDRVWREGNLIRGEGVFANNDLGRETARMVDERELRGISVDVAVRAYEVGPLSDYVNERGEWVGPAAGAAAADAESPDMVDVVYGDEPMLLVVTDGVIGSACICPFPAFAEAQIALTAAAAPAVWTWRQQLDMTIVGGRINDGCTPNALTAASHHEAEADEVSVDRATTEGAWTERFLSNGASNVANRFLSDEGNTTANPYATDANPDATADASANGTRDSRQKSANNDSSARPNTSDDGLLPRAGGESYERPRSAGTAASPSIGTTLRGSSRNRRGGAASADAPSPTSQAGEQSGTHISIIDQERRRFADGSAARAIAASGASGTIPNDYGALPNTCVSAEWFTNPGLDWPTPVTITDDGYIYGHAALHGTCHIGISGACVTPPESRSGYAYFHLGEFVCEDGQRVAVGKVTIDTGHAAAHLGRAAAASHYDDTGSVAAYVVAGEDDHGIWVAGTVAPGLDDATLAKLRGSVLSGDWRAVNGHLELVALLAVNVPGFPVPRAPKAMIAAAGGREQVLSLVAAGICRPQDVAAARIRDLAARASGEMARLAARAGR